MPSLAELRDLAKTVGLKGHTSLRKEALAALLDKHAAEVAAKTAEKPVEAIAVEDVKVAAPPKERRRDARERQAKAKEEKEAGTFVPEVKVAPARKNQSIWQDFLAERRAAGETMKIAMTKKDEYATYKAKMTEVKA
jgi:hypothetical protein